MPNLTRNWERYGRALTLRRGGLTFAAIGKELGGVSHARARQMVLMAIHARQKGIALHHLPAVSPEEAQWYYSVGKGA